MQPGDGNVGPTKFTAPNINEKAYAAPQQPRSAFAINAHSAVQFNSVPSRTLRMDNLMPGGFMAYRNNLSVPSLEL
jgi:hypothetical protein